MLLFVLDALLFQQFFGWIGVSCRPRSPKVPQIEKGGVPATEIIDQVARREDYVVVLSEHDRVCILAQRFSGCGLRLGYFLMHATTRPWSQIFWTTPQGLVSFKSNDSICTTA